MDSYNIFLFESRNDSLLPIAIILEMHGCHTALSCNDEDCNGRLGNANNTSQGVDLLITDMPARILNELKFGSMPVLVIVNPGCTGAMSVIREKGFQYLEKPVDPVVLLGKITDILHRGKK
jgi:DNA-binding NtrC family response regulator